MAKQSLFNPKPDVSASAATETTLVAPFDGMGSSMTTAARPDDAAGPTNCYITHVGPKSDKWVDYAAMFPGLAPNDAILRAPDADPIKMSSITFYLFDLFRYYAQLDAQFAPAKTWPDTADDAELRKLKPRVFETVSSLILVCTPDGGITPATYRVTDGMSQGVKKAFLVCTEEVGTDEWFGRSNDHLLTKRIQQPNLRAKFTLTWKPSKSRSTGYTYFTSQLSVAPTTVGDFGALTAAMATDAAETDLQNAKASFAEWQAKIQSKF